MHELPVPIVKGVILKASQIPGTATASMPSQEEITAVKKYLKPCVSSRTWMSIQSSWWWWCSTAIDAETYAAYGTHALGVSKYLPKLEREKWPRIQKKVLKRERGIGIFKSVCWNKGRDTGDQLLKRSVWMLCLNKESNLSQRDIDFQICNARI